MKRGKPQKDVLDLMTKDELADSAQLKFLRRRLELALNREAKWAALSSSRNRLAAAVSSTDDPDGEIPVIGYQVTLEASPEVSQLLYKHPEADCIAEPVVLLADHRLELSFARHELQVAGAKLAESNAAHEAAAQHQGELNTRIYQLEQQLADQLELLRMAREFVVNGVEHGYIQMPDADTPDPAHALVPKIDVALYKASGTAPVDIWADFLTARKKCILAYVAEGKTFEQIAGQLNLVDAEHAQRIYEANSPQEHQQ